MVDFKFNCNCNSNRINETIIIIPFSSSAYKKKKHLETKSLFKWNIKAIVTGFKFKSNCFLKSMRVNWKRTTYCSFAIRFGFGFEVWTNHRDNNNKTTNNNIMAINVDDRRMNERHSVSFHLMLWLWCIDSARNSFDIRHLF